MQSTLPKVMHLMNGKPLVDYVVSAVESLGIKPVVVISKNSTAVKDYLGERVLYAIQEKQLGTGHAVAMAENLLKGKVDHVVVLYGDMPFITAKSIKRLIAKHIADSNVLTLFTTVVPDFTGWRSQFYDFGRVMRGARGELMKIVQKKDATPEGLEIKEFDTCYFCFRADWLWKNLKKLKNNNAQGEYYLTDLVKLAFAQKEKLSSIEINPREAIGINTKEHLEEVKKI
jgi:bifunctional UDP-N-acetylglucosamine pyrophosphorylase/glucosamine-1-phosphate N-acetyltransferase